MKRDTQIRAASRGPRTPEAKVYASLLRTADALFRGTEEVLEPFGLSHTQYNVLRILRGAGPEGLCRREISERMITRDPDITRLLTRLEARRLITRARRERDHRVVCTRITRQGLRLLTRLDQPIEELRRRQLGPLGRRGLASLRRLLEQARAATI